MITFLQRKMRRVEGYFIIIFILSCLFANGVTYPGMNESLTIPGLNLGLITGIPSYQPKILKKVG